MKGFLIHYLSKRNKRGKKLPAAQVRKRKLGFPVGLEPVVKFPVL